MRVFLLPLLQSSGLALALCVSVCCGGGLGSSVSGPSPTPPRHAGEKPVPGPGGQGFRATTITIPTKTHGWTARTMSLFGDIDNDGRADLLAVGPAENTLWVFRQRASGFGATPDQAIVLPPQTAWIALCDVDAHPGVELVLSTASGLFYLRQDDGV